MHSWPIIVESMSDTNRPGSGKSSRATSASDGAKWRSSSSRKPARSSPGVDIWSTSLQASSIAAEASGSPRAASAAVAASRRVSKVAGSAISRAMSNGQSPGGKAVALIAGPTASGKSDLAVELALELGRRGARGVVLNADSAQVYRDLAVLSARPAPGEMRGVDHRLFGAWDGAESCSAADWAAAAKREIAALHEEGAVPILVGGTG